MASQVRARILSLHGDLDLPKKQALREALASVATSPLAIVDLSDVAYVDSMALAEFVRVTKTALARNDRILWVAPQQSNVRRILQLAKLDRYFELFSSVADARAALAA